MATRLKRMTLPELLERYRVYTIRELARRTGLSSQQAWNLGHGVAGIGRLTLERLHEAKEMLSMGMQVAFKVADHHAYGEMEGILQSIS